MALAAGVLLAACWATGSGSQATVVAGGDRREPDREREPRREAQVDRALHLARLRDLAAAGPQARVRGRAGRAHHGASAAAASARSSTSAARCSRAASRGCCRSRSRPTTRARAGSTSTSPTSPATSASSSTSARARPAPTPGSARLVLRMADSEGNHNGGLLLFGPDKHLYIGTGDGGGAGDQHGARGNAQNLRSLLGKLLRIDPAASGGQPYTRPRRQPVPRTAAARGREIYSYGLRNPWRFSFDRRTGDLAIGDVGQDAVEEIDFVRRGKGEGANFGWRAVRGPLPLRPGRERARPRAARDHAHPRRRLVLDHRRRRGARPRAHRAARALPVRRHLQAADLLGEAQRRQRHLRAHDVAARRQHLLVRRGRPRARLRRLARGPVYRLVPR